MYLLSLIFMNTYRANNQELLLVASFGCGRIITYCTFSTTLDPVRSLHKFGIVDNTESSHRIVSVSSAYLFRILVERNKCVEDIDTIRCQISVLSTVPHIYGVRNAQYLVSWNQLSSLTYINNWRINYIIKEMQSYPRQRTIVVFCFHRSHEDLVRYLPPKISSLVGEIDNDEIGQTGTLARH